MRPRELSEATKLAIHREKTGPWCDVCGYSMPQESRDRGENSHPNCDPNELKVSGN